MYNNSKHGQGKPFPRSSRPTRSFAPPSFQHWPLAGRASNFSTMSHYPLDNLSDPKTPTQDEFKASYDDLLDENVTPYAPTARHRTYTVDSLGGSLRSPATPLSHKTHFSAKQSDDLSQHTSRAVYPPQHVTRKPTPLASGRRSESRP